MSLPTRIGRLLFVVGVLIGFATTAPGATPDVQKTTPTYTRTIYLIRHGAYDMVEQPGDETTAYGLTPLGIAQAWLIGARLRGMPVKFDSLVSSTYTRARQTAQVIGQSFPTLALKTDRLLCECLPAMRTSQPRPDANPVDMAAAEAQLNEAFTKYFVPATDHDRHDLIVAHGNAIRYWVVKALGVDPKAWAGLSLAHCSLTIIQVRSDGTCKILAVGDTGHIPPNLLSGNSRTNPELVATGAAP